MTLPNYQAIDANTRGSLTAVSSVDDTTIVRLTADPVTGALLVSGAGGGGTMTKYNVTGTVNSSNVTFTIPVAVTSDFLLILVNQFQMLGIDYTYSAGGGITTITMTTAPDTSLSGLGFQAYVTT